MIVGSLKRSNCAIVSVLTPSTPDRSLEAPETDTASLVAGGGWGVKALACW